MPHTLANLDGLVRLSKNEGVDIRRPLLRVLTDLYVQEPSHTREEEQQYVELALQLLPGVDPMTRAAVARKLAAYAHTPAPIIEVLSQDAADIAALFSAAAAARAIDSADAAAAPASAAKAEDELAPSQADSAADNMEEALPATADMPLVDSIGEIFLASTSAERVSFLMNMERATATGSTPPFSMLVRPGVSQRLEQAALAHDQEAFARELRLSLGLSRETASRIVEDNGGEPLLVAARALGVADEMLVRILLCLNPAIGHSIERVFSLVPLYARMTSEMIEPVVTSWREQAASRPSARLQSLLATDDDASLVEAREHARTPRDGNADHTPRRRIGTERRQRGQGTA